MNRTRITLDDYDGPSLGQTCRIVVDTATGQHYWLSEVGTEAMAFACDVEADGTFRAVTDWSNVAGQPHQPQTLDSLQAELDRRLEDGTDPFDDYVDAQGGVEAAFFALLDDLLTGGRWGGWDDDEAVD